MPPRSSLTSSFSITDANNEVICPLSNQDGSNCRKRCIGEHIRRAHPEHYISKLPATEESFMLMVSTPPSERPPVDSSPTASAQGPVTPRHSDEYSSAPNRMFGSGTLTAAAAVLAELHGVKSEREIDTDGGYHSDVDGRRIPQTSIELPPLHQLNHDVTSDPFTNRHLLPSLFSGSPPGRSSTLPPLQRPTGPTRPRKQSISKRRDGHTRRPSRGAATAADWLRRIQNDDRTRTGDRKALSVEPTADFGKRWEDLIDAATSANGDLDDDRTPMPQSPVSIHRSSMPPFTQQNLHQNNYQASPLQQALTPPSHKDHIDPFPSVESGENFHMGTGGLSDSSPIYSAHNIQIYCAACQGISLLKNSYACTECISGLCAPCVEILMAEHGARRKCPRCATIGGHSFDEVDYMISLLPLLPLLPPLSPLSTAPSTASPNHLSLSPLSTASPNHLSLPPLSTRFSLFALRRTGHGYYNIPPAHSEPRYNDTLFFFWGQSLLLDSSFHWAHGQSILPFDTSLVLASLHV
ncbi:transcription factor [Cordyceps militaris]|uniref:Transcription factor n=1 Tax=Cordyceps militaris TaxID=73501 RepID=A0A2H4S5U5_CORMI|nr:transcription factor [Cordyceps militaris]